VLDLGFLNIPYGFKQFWRMLSMKHNVGVFTPPHIALITCLFFIALSLFLTSSSWAETDAGDELISLTAKNEPLGDVVYKISMATGYDISVDNKWQNYRVTASLEDVSLHKGLKRILRDLNSAIIYVSSKKIRIIIYDKTASEDASYAPSAGKPIDRTPVFQGRSYPPSEHRPPTSEVIEKEDRSETDEEPSDSTVVSDQESESNPLAGDGEDNTKPESIPSEPSEGAQKDFEDKSPEKSSQ
jgi:type II secretory pathway component GspD/PulD (secretin)